ncbi:MAG TPA: polyketide synthase [Stellaceae bacterium]|nr:polyketide synthase [Stellaceae bacterium]
MTSYIDYLDTLSKKQLMVMLARQKQEETQGIAVVGLGCRFSGGIDDPESFWTVLREGRVVPMMSDRPPADSLGRPRWNLDAPDLAPMADMLRSGAYLGDVDLFDAEYFGISEEEAAHMDPQQRLVLEVAIQALADANLSRAALRGRPVGIFIGSVTAEYPLALPIETITPLSGTGTLQSALSGRLGLMLGVNGPAVTIDTASSSVLTSLHLAVQSLRRRECDIAIVGASHLVLSPFLTTALARADMLSPTGRCRPFAEDANGYVRAEGCGMLVLKRNQDAAADGDLPYAQIRGSAIYQHGGRLGLSIASAAGQKTTMELALRNAGIDPLDVSYVEAQANGSRLGAVVEAEAIVDAYGRQSPTAPPLYLGSCKANIGYLEHASGAAGLIKLALALAHGEIPPQVGAERLDPDISRLSREGAALRFARKPTPWPATGRRAAGVSAVSLTGLGAHVVLEGVSDRAATPPEPLKLTAPALLVLSAHNPAALTASAERLCRHLDRRGDWDHVAVCRTLANGRDQLKFRCAAVVRDRQSVLDSLARFSDGAPKSASPSERVGLFVVLPEFDREQLSRALAASRQPGFEPLDHRIRARAEKLGLPASDDMLAGERGAPQAVALAWSLGWLDLLSSAGIEVVGGTLGNAHWRALAAVIMGRSDGDAVCAAWRAGTMSALPAIASGAGWEIASSGQTTTVRRPARSTTAPARLAEFDVPHWLELVADRFRAGADLSLSALWTPSRGGMCRLPGPVLTGKSYWLDHSI